MSKRLLFIGLDGAAPELIERFLPELPNFNKLIKSGAWGAMLSTYPCDTPTNWTALATGATAATSGITGFAFHEPGSSLSKSGSAGRDYDKFRKAEFLWEALDRQGHKSLLLNYPFSWYSRDMKNTIIVGGDQIVGGISEHYGEGFFCSPDLPPESGKPLRLLADKTGELHGEIVFQRTRKHLWTAVGVVETEEYQGFDCQITLKALPGKAPEVVLSLNGQQLARLERGQWSSFVTIPANGELAYVRFYLASINEDCTGISLYHSRITRDRGFSKPDHVAEHLVHEIGPFQPGSETAHIAIHAYRGQNIALDIARDELRTIGETMVGYARTLMREHPDWRACFLQLHANDSLNHTLLADLDPNSPITTPEQRSYAEQAFLENYIETDRLLGNLLTIAEEKEALVVVVSDHGCLPTHTWISVSRALMDHGLMHFCDDGLWDPAHSKVRKMINGSLYINLKGRQPDGIVDPKEYEHTRDEIISALYGIRDPYTGNCPIRLAARREDVSHLGTDGPGWGDVIFAMKPGYTDQWDHEGGLVKPIQMGYSMLTKEEQGAAIARGYGRSTGLRGNHHVYMPHNPDCITSNRAILGFYGPGVKAGVGIKDARTIDIASTLAEYLRVEPPRQNEGQVLKNILDGVK
jgi:predicted AlkP superfamily phosphohydrolase/phosphomutase